uniref:Heat shock factor binding protein 1 n=1 Tax=Rousettus aegyptiacus TaxID=9407 RepID=A0A7J8CGX5_ROUAE|nr:heat shock factor binding protein 1 [Rousettus aegyptiacus]
MAETDPKTVQDLTSVVRDDCASPGPRHPQAAPARPADPGTFFAPGPVSGSRVPRGFACGGLRPA